MLEQIIQFIFIAFVLSLFVIFFLAILIFICGGKSENETKKSNRKKATNTQFEEKNLSQ